MYTACIAVVDASRARLFTLERTSEPEGVTEQLTEQRDLVDPARRLRPAQLFSETRPGTDRSGTVQYTLDDHRDKHLATLDAEFARAIEDELAELMRTSHARKLVVCASPNMLGELRRARKALPDDLVIDEIARDLVKLTPSELREQLASYGILPAPPPRRM
jgi:protein required for attachment to host cells